MQLARAEYGEQLDGMLKTRPWAEVATYAAYCCQGDFLQLRPWQQPPIHGDVPPIDDGALQLLARMLAVGVSRYHPDPERAIAAAEAARGAPDLPPAA